MRWQLLGPWPVGAICLPTGTILDSAARSWPMPPPLDARALDEEAAMEMCMSYHEDLWHRLHFHPSVDREAVLAQARHNKRWPNGVPSQSTTQPISEAPIAVKEEKPQRPSRRR